MRIDLLRVECVARCFGEASSGFIQQMFNALCKQRSEFYLSISPAVLLAAGNLRIAR